MPEQGEPIGPHSSVTWTAQQAQPPAYAPFPHAVFDDLLPADVRAALATELGCLATDTPACHLSVAVLDAPPGRRLALWRRRLSEAVTGGAVLEVTMSFDGVLDPAAAQATRPGASAPGAAPAKVAKPLYDKPVQLRGAGASRPRILAVGSSTGGPQALFQFFKDVRPEINMPVVVTQHMPATFTTILAEHIAKASGWPCTEAKDGEAKDKQGKTPKTELDKKMNESFETIPPDSPEKKNPEQKNPYFLFWGRAPLAAALP